MHVPLNRYGAAATPGKPVVCLLLLISLAGIFNHELWTPDEPREAALVMAMRRERDFVVPRLAGEAFVEKPPLAYIAAAGVSAVFEPLLGTTGALRLASALWGLATLLVTFLLARRLAGPAAGVWALAALAVMPGFIQVTHWLLVDPALMFFIAAALWLFNEAYAVGRNWLLLPAALFLAAAFLTKGLVGPIIVFIGWCGIIFELARRGQWRRLCRRSGWWWHLAALAVFLLPAGIWMVVLRVHGGPELWREWFWDNHFGRFTGQARHLGHIRGPFYYISALAVCLLPWLACWVQAIIDALRRLSTALTRLRGAWPLPLAWVAGGLLLLTASSSKREIYLSMLMPGMAIMTGMLAPGPHPVWVRHYLRAWMWLGLLVLAAAVPAPLAAWALGYFGGGLAVTLALLAAVVLAAAWMICRSRAWPWMWRWLTVTGAAYCMLLTVAPPILDHFKNYGPGFVEIADAVPSDLAGAVGAWEFDETHRAGFYYYCDLVFPAVSDKLELSRILAGEHPRLRAVILCRRRAPDELQLPDEDVLAAVAMGPRRRLMLVGDLSAAGNTSGSQNAQ